MTQHINALRHFYQKLTILELIALRHDAIRLGDNETKKMIDEEIKRRQSV